MTRMSEIVGDRRAVNRDNPLESYGGSGLACRAHDLSAQVFRLLPVASLTACVIPPSLSVGTEDAPVNAPPAIIAVHTAVEELAKPGPVVFDVGSQDTLSIDLFDPDVNDTLYVRIFVDYNYPDRGNSRSFCDTAPTGNTKRTASCPELGICLSGDIGRTMPEPFLTIDVFDRKLDDSNGNHQTMIDPDGQRAENAYILTCRPST